MLDDANDARLACEERRAVAEAKVARLESALAAAERRAAEEKDRADEQEECRGSAEGLAERLQSKLDRERAALVAAERRATEAEYRCEQWAARSVERRVYDEAVVARERASERVEALRDEMRKRAAMYHGVNSSLSRALRERFEEVGELLDALLAAPAPPEHAPEQDPVAAMDEWWERARPNPPPVPREDEGPAPDAPACPTCGQPVAPRTP